MLLLQVIVGGLLLGAIYALFSSGLTLIWGMMNFINFAHGEFVMLGMYVAMLAVIWIGGGPAVFGFAAAFALFVLGVIIYFSLIRHVTRGPMLAQILSTFGLALLLRYTAFWLFSANVVSLPNTSLGGTLNIFGILVPVAQLVAGVTAAVLTVAMHLFLTRTTMGSKLLAVAEDRNAAMLMGIRPDRMQALAWGLAAASAGIAGALMAISYPWSPFGRRDIRPHGVRRGDARRLRQRARRDVCGPDHRPDPGALGLLSRADLQGHRGLRAVRRAALVPAAGPAGQGVTR